MDYLDENADQQIDHRDEEEDQQWDDERDNEIKQLNFNNARLASIIYSIVKHKGKEWNLLLENAAEDDLPSEIRIGYNIVGDDAIVTVLFGSALKRMVIQGAFEDPADEPMRQMLKEEEGEK